MDKHKRRPRDPELKITIECLIKVGLATLKKTDENWSIIDSSTIYSITAALAL